MNVIILVQTFKKRGHKNIIYIVLSNFSKIVTDTELKFSGFTKLLMSYLMTYHTMF